MFFFKQLNYVHADNSVVLCVSDVCNADTDAIKLYAVWVTTVNPSAPTLNPQTGDKNIISWLSGKLPPTEPQFLSTACNYCGPPAVTSDRDPSYTECH